MKIKLLSFCALLMFSGSCVAMMRSARIPMVKLAQAPVRSHALVAHIKSKYPLPNARPGTTPIAHMTREQLTTHMKHQELCWKVSKSFDAQIQAKKILKSTTKELAKTIKPLIAGYVSMNNTDVGPELFRFACLETELSLECVRQAWKEYKKMQKDIETAEQALADLVAEQKLQIKVPYDIQ